MKTKRAFSLPIILTLVSCVIINLIAWRSAAFSDFYTDNIFPVLSGIYGRITSPIPFSLGEFLLVALVLYVGFSILFIFVHTIILIVDKLKKPSSKGFTNIKNVFGKISNALYRFTPVLLSVTCVVMTLNCFILYHCSRLNEVEGAEDVSYDLQQLADLRDYVVKKCNALAKVVPHDEDGNVIYEGDMAATAIASMEKLSDNYKRLGGYYVNPKALYFSEFMCQQYMQGYYFPFSMEANYNDEMSIMNKPFTMCHELAHTHGYIYEDEANYLAFLACIGSDDVVFQYSGYLGVLNYINNDFYKAVSKEEYKSHVKISKRVLYDNQFVTEEGWKKVEANAVVKTETVKKAAATFIDTNLKANGVLSGSVSYAHVVGLIMDYYYTSPEYAENGSLLASN